MKTLGGCLFTYEAIKHDYNFAETITCLKELCDQVVVVDCGSSDGTVEELKKLEDEKTLVVYLDKEEWEKQQGKEKIAYFQNFAAQFLISDYYIVLQADEILGRESFSKIREAVDEGFEAYFVTRVNLWKDSRHKLIVPHEKQPCGTNIIRIAKTKYLSIGDGEGIECQLATTKYLNDIKIWHMGFVRLKSVMKSKITHMQKDVFGITPDPKLGNMEIFQWDAWFSRWDLQEVSEPLPEFIQEWAIIRDKANTNL